MTAAARWFLILLLAIVLSAFLHEAGHGLSASLHGHPVSTGFNRVGDHGRHPGDPDFRANLAAYRNPWDLGPAVTLTLAAASTFALYRVKGGPAIAAAGAMALANSVQRLIPLGMAYGAWLTTGTPGWEDEIAQGQLWSELYGAGILRHLPALIAAAVSLLCLRLGLRGLRRLGLDRRALLIGGLAAFLLAMPLLNLLDRLVRINWP